MTVPLLFFAFMTSVMVSALNNAITVSDYVDSNDILLNLSTSQIENKIHSYIKTIGGEQYLTGNIIDFLKYLEDGGQARMNFLTKKNAQQNCLMNISII